jgi:hypothetical protein
MVNRFENLLVLGIAHVNVRMHEAENEILSEENCDDGLATQEREEGRQERPPSKRKKKLF